MKPPSFLYEFVFIRTCRPGSVLLLNISKKEKEYTAMNEVLEKIQKTGIVPVVVLDDARDAAPLARALCEGGLPCAEVTFRTEAAEESIRIMTAEYSQMLVGAGTVLTPGQADRAVGAGAQFIVSPGLNPAVVTHCLKKGITVIPGVCTPSEVETAIALGLSVVKFFPAEQAGGIPMIQALAAPYTQMRFMPTGGIHAQNVNSYLAYDRVLACGGSWMVKKELIAAGEFDKIRDLTKEAVQTMLGFTLAHVGINCENETEAGITADTFGRLFGFTKDERSTAVFAGNAIEAMKAPGRGTKGHIAIAANSVARARNYLEMMGVSFDESSAKYQDGMLKFIYLSDEPGGFAVHLTQK